MTAAYLRHYFPDFWAAHVASKPITTSRLVGVFHAFLELADDALLAIDTSHPCPLSLNVPPEEIPALVDGYRDEGGTLWTLGNELYYWIAQPPVEVYGIDPDELGQSWRAGEHRLYLALCWMLRQTTWQQVGLSAGDVRLLRGGRGIVALPNLHPDVPMDALADALTWSCPLDGIEGAWALGGVLRLVCGQTHNEFADYSPAEAAQDMAWWCEGIYDEPERLAYERQKQQGARHLRAVYDALDARVSREPALLAEIAVAIVDTAYGVAARAGARIPLVELLGARDRIRAGAEGDLCAA